MLDFLAAVGVLWHLSVSVAEKLKIVNLCFIMKKTSLMSLSFPAFSSSDILGNSEKSSFTLDCFYIQNNVPQQLPPHPTYRGLMGICVYSGI